MFGDFFPGLKRTIEGLQEAVFQPSAGSFRETERASRAECGAAQKTSHVRWSGEAFRASMRHHGLSGTFPSELPHEIDLREFRRPLERLLELTKSDGREYGRVGVIAPWKDSLRLLGTSRGTNNEVRIVGQFSSLERAVIFIHTHPTQRGLTAAHSYNFSLQDFESFLTTPSTQVVVVVADGLTLLLYKTDRTPSLSPEVVERLHRLELEIFANSLIPADRKGARFTKRACEQFKIGLFAHKHSSPEYVAQRIETANS